MDLKLETFDRFSAKHNWFLHTWTKARNFDLPTECMSDYGFMAFDGETPLAAMFMYPVVGADFALVGFPISEPRADKDERKQAIDTLVAEIEKVAKTLNYKFLVSYPGNKASQAIFERLEYASPERDVIQFIKKL